VTNTGLRGRWEILQESPKVICDTAHNAEGLSYTMEQLRQEEGGRRHLVIGVVSDKDLAKFFRCFRPGLPIILLVLASPEEWMPNYCRKQRPAMGFTGGCTLR